MPRQRSRSMRHLELKRRVWWMDIGLPADIRHAFDGRKRHRTNLRTGDLRTAMERRDETERELMTLFKDIRRGTVKVAAEEAAAMRGEAWRQTIAGPAEHDRDFLVGLAQEEAERLEARRSTERAAKAFTRGLTGQHPVDHFVVDTCHSPERQLMVWDCRTQSGTSRRRAVDEPVRTE